MLHTFYHWTEHFIVISGMIGLVISGIVLLVLLIMFIRDCIDAY